MHTKIKICGLSRLEDIEAVNVVKPDYIGFVFAESRRKVTPRQARELRGALHESITPVGVFVNETIENILELVRNNTIDMIQLHGAEDENFIEKLKSQTDAKIIKAVSIQNKGDAQKWENSSADFLLLDQKGGGTGETFDWSLIGEVAKPFFLAGGLSAKNVADAIKKISPYAVDTSSGVEISPGVKCPEEIKKFVQNRF
ncbi:MAG: phosphoribosylanthranilate isomerase [Defluviitaleaceae bacterium]|nr:phosphoribosylanthranilate isomerase [Defluviitaleaceae bacterium]